MGGDSLPHTQTPPPSSLGCHLGAGLGCAIDGHTGDPPEVGHVHLSEGAQSIRRHEVIRNLWENHEQGGWHPMASDSSAQGRNVATCTNIAAMGPALR